VRKYKTGTRWCFWRWTDVQSEYITRLHIIKTPWFAVCLHWLNKPDPDPYLHDHPVSFLSVILRGAYTEVTMSGFQNNYWFNFVRATDTHRIIAVRPKTLTLCFMGPKTQDWGFFTPEGKVYWKDYYARGAK